MRIETISAAIAIASLAWLLWVVAGFPLLVRIAGRLAGPRPRPAGTVAHRVSFLVPCRNEEGFAAEKARNLRELGRTLGSWEAIMIDDCSTDRTSEILASVEGAGISVIRTEARSGKIAALRLASRCASGQILVVTDCGSAVRPESLGPLLAWFDDPKVGLVTGTYRPQPSVDDPRAEGERAYWKSEMELREAETRLGTTTHATGALFAVRAALFRGAHWPDGVTNDDIHLPVQVLQMGYDVVCEPAAVAVERVDTDIPGEFRRRARIASGNFQMIRELPGLAQAGRWLAAVQLVSHKILRNALGFPLAGLLVAGLLASGTTGGLIFLVVQVAAYGMAFTGFLRPGKGWLARRSATAGYVLLAIAASSWGFVAWLLGRNPTTWERTDHAVGVRHA